MPKYIFVTGGVVSGLGKGITAASLGVLLKSCGLSLDAVKFDPYLNIDPGTMSPYEHGEVYVLSDGSETDLDLGHYERFLDTDLSGISSVASGRIYADILDQERAGKFLGKNVQLIPHVTNYIKMCFAREAKADVRLIEIGGSTGDYEGDIFLESLRQFRRENLAQVFHIHLGYVPFLKCSREYKTKPLQVSIRDLSRSGLQPDMVVARYSIEDGQKLSDDIMKKIALFANLPSESVIELPDMENIYQVPIYLQETGVVKNLETFLNQRLDASLPKFFGQYQVLKSDSKIKIGIIAKYTKLLDAYLSIIESLKIAGVEFGVGIEPVLIDAEELDSGLESAWQSLRNLKGIVVPGGFGVRGMEGKIKAINYARINKIPILGICLGLQMAAIEIARSLGGLDAVSAEMFEDKNPMIGKSVLIDLMPGQAATTKKGGTMRLGSYSCNIVGGTIAAELYNQEVIQERHRHRLEVQLEFVPILEQSGLVISGKHILDQNGNYLVEMIELPKEVHPYFIATQSHPEFLSRPGRPHPLFAGLVRACLG